MYTVYHGVFRALLSMLLNYVGVEGLMEDRCISNKHSR